MSSPAPPFIIGVFADDEVPTDGAGDNACQTWKARGCNAAFLVPQGHDVAGWDYRNTAAGLRVVRAWANTPPTNTGSAGLLALASDLCSDEPDEHAANVDALVAESAQLRAAHPGIPLYQSVSGGKIMGMEGATFSDADYTRLLAAYDIVAADIYPVTGWGQPNQLRWAYDAQVRLAALAPHATRCAFIECSNQRLSWVAADATDTGTPNPDQMTAEVYLSLIAGAKGIIWFAESIGVWAADATTPAEQSALASINTFLAAHADFFTKGTLATTIAHPRYRGDWTLNGQVLTLTVDLTNTDPQTTWNVGTVAATAGATPAPTPVPITPVVCTMARDIRHNRWDVTIAATKGHPAQVVLISDPATVALIDQAVAKAAAK